MTGGPGAGDGSAAGGIAGGAFRQSAGGALTGTTSQAGGPGAGDGDAAGGFAGGGLNMPQETKEAGASSGSGSRAEYCMPQETQEAGATQEAGCCPGQNGLNRCRTAQILKDEKRKEREDEGALTIRSPQGLHSKVTSQLCDATDGARGVIQSPQKALLNSHVGSSRGITAQDEEKRGPLG